MNPDNAFKHEFDLHVFMEKNDGEDQHLGLKAINTARTVAWLFDTSMNEIFYENIVTYMDFDHVYCGNPDFIKGHKNRSYLPYAADKTLFYRSPDTPKTIDVCLVGSDRPERRKLIKSLQKDGVNAELISGVFKEDYINTLAASKIVVNDLAGGGANLLSMRTFEAPAAGALLLQAMSSSIYGVLEDGVTCATFHSEESLISSARFYLNNEEDRKRVTSNGQYWVLNHCSYENRAKEILSAKV
jgi:spore maturation protein CgeB